MKIMKNLKLPIGTLIETIAEFKKLKLYDNEEIEVSHLGITIETPTNYQLINNVIKKNKLPGRKFNFDDGTSLHCADGHILYCQGNEIKADQISVGETIDTINDPKKISSIVKIDTGDYYDVGINYPHKYVDSNGVIHHNTIMTAALSQRCEAHGRTIVIVPNKSLVTQTEKDYKGLELDVGVYYGDRKDIGKTHTICTWQSLNNLLKNTKNYEADITIHEFLEGVVCVMVDECHMVKASALKDLLTSVCARIPIRWGLTGTVPKEPFEFQALKCSLGSVINQLSASELQDRGVLAQCHVNIVQLIDHSEFTNYQSELKFLLENSKRLETVAKLVAKVNLTGNTLVLVDRVAAGHSLVELLGDQAVFVSGATKGAKRDEEYNEVATSTDKIIVATYGVAAVGINIPRIFNLVLVEPGKSFVRVIQSIGRGIRKAEDKDHVQIWDVTSTCKFAKRHLNKRKEFYREANYPYTQEKLEWK
jgi:hypothetical protein